MNNLPLVRLLLVCLLVIEFWNNGESTFFNQNFAALVVITVIDWIATQHRVAQIRKGFK